MKKTNFRLFLVEDDDNDAYMIERAIRQTGVPCELTRFHEPTAAIEVLSHMEDPQRDAPHLILTDLKMPRMTGLEFVQWLRASQFSCIPIVMLSGSSLPEDILAAYRHGTNSFSTKPVDVHDLEEIARTFMKYWNETCKTPTSVLLESGSICGK